MAKTFSEAFIGLQELQAKLILHNGITILMVELVHWL
jgi:hypothetical protein